MKHPAVLLFLVLLCSSCSREPEQALPARLVISVPYEIDTLDPHARDRLSNAAISGHFYEPLVVTDTEMGLRPALAVRWNNPDLLTWVFELRSGVTFHDGSPLGPEDVVYTFKRILEDPSLEFGMYAVQITSVKPAGESTVEMKTRRPMGILLNKISTIGIVKRGSGPELATHVNGTGPYRLESWSAKEMVLKRNESHWGPPPDVGDVVLHLGRTPEEALGELTRGESHLAQCSSRSAAEAAEKTPGVRIRRRTGIFLKYLGFDLVSKSLGGSPNPFASVEVREAISCAVDRASLSSRLSTFATPASQFVPPFIFGFNPSLPPLVHDLGRAKSLLSKNGHGNGLDVTLHTRLLLQEPAALVSRELSNAGIRATVKALPDAEFFDLARAGKLSFYLTRFGCASGDISDILDAAFHSVDSNKRFGTSNFASYREASLDEAIEQSAEIVEAADRRVSLFALGEKIRASYLLVPLYYDEDVYAIRQPFSWEPRANSYILAQEVRVPKEK